MAAGRPAARAIGLEHEAVEGTLADLAHEQLDEKPPLRLVGPLEEPAQRLRAALGRARALLRGEHAHRLVDLGQGQGRAFGRTVRLRRLDGAPAEADPALGQGAGEIQGQKLGLAPSRLPERLGDQRDLLGLLGRASDAADEVDQLGQEQGAFPRRSRSSAFRRGLLGQNIER